MALGSHLAVKALHEIFDTSTLQILYLPDFGLCHPRYFCVTPNVLKDTHLTLQL